MRFDKKTLLFLVLLFLPVLSNGEEIKRVNNQLVYQQIQQKTAPFILDVRSEQEYQGGHVPGSYNIPHTQMADRLKELSDYKNKPVYVYCRSGRRAGIAEKVLLQAGFTQLHHIDGDILGWQAAKLPLEK